MRKEKHDVVKYWIISDTHFGHDKMYEYCGRSPGFEAKILKNIGNVVGKEDVLIHLGDFCIRRDEHWHKVFMETCGAKKWLIRGNHDRKSSTWYHNKGWDFVGEQVVLKKFGKKILFSHKPYSGDQDCLNIHGHLHNTFHHEEFQRVEKNAVLFVLEHSYSPVRLKRIIEEYETR